MFFCGFTILSNININVKSFYFAAFEISKLRLFRRVFQILCEHHYDILMVAADAGDSFGDFTTEYLGRLRREKGTLLAVCTKHYGEMTASAYSSHEEVKFALDYKSSVTVLPLKVEDTYPPRPPCGPDHEFDKKKLAQGYIDMIFRPSVVFLDCRNKSEMDIAAEIAKLLQKYKASACPDWWQRVLHLILKIMFRCPKTVVSVSPSKLKRNGGGLTSCSFGILEFQWVICLAWNRSHRASSIHFWKGGGFASDDMAFFMAKPWLVL